MNRTYSQNTQTLPRIRSQGKFNRIATHTNDRQREKEEDPNRSEEKRTLTRLSSERKTLQSANISKAVRYEATNAIYLKKIEVLEKQSFFLEKQIAAANQQISHLRIKRKTNDDNYSVSSKATQVSKRSKLGTQPNLTRLQALRKKIDKQNEKNRQTQLEVDKIRKEINTTKHLNEQLFADLKYISEKLESDTRVSLKLDEQIASKKEQLKRKKIQSIHQKTHLIRNYDMVLKKLDEELATDPTNNEKQSINNNIYLTDVYLSTKERKKPREYTENSPKAKRNAAQLTHFKERIEQCEQHFQQLKESTGCNTIEEAINKFSQTYQENFSKYQFINQRFKHLQQLRQKNGELNQRKQQLQQSLSSCQTSRSACDLLRAREKITEVVNQKQAIKDKIKDCEKLFVLLKHFVSEAVKKVPLSKARVKYQIDQFTDFDEIITRDNLQQFLDEILAARQQNSRKNQKEASIVRSEMTGTLQQCLQNARKEGLHEKERFLGRQQLMQVGKKQSKAKNIRN